MQTHIDIPVCHAVARAIDALSLPGEKREDTIARIVWAFATAPTLRPDDRFDPKTDR